MACIKNNLSQIQLQKWDSIDLEQLYVKYIALDGQK